jgi:hypothetical protein
MFQDVVRECIVEEAILEGECTGNVSESQEQA